MSGKFVGQYVDDMVVALTASALSGVNLRFVGAPGYGKTRVCKVVAKHIFGDAWKKFQLDPSTPPDRLHPKPDYQKWMTDNEFVLILAGSIQDPILRAIILDELARANDPVFDSLLSPLAGEDENGYDLPEEQKKVFWATENFRTTGDRVQAMNDRFGINVPLPDHPQLDYYLLARSALSARRSGMEIHDGLPTLEDILRIRQYDPDQNEDAAELVATTVASLAAEGIKGVFKDKKQVATFVPNPRRIEQWSNMLYAYSAFLTNDPNFKIIPDKAKYILQWMWPCKDDKEAAYWKEVCGSIADPIQAAIDQLTQDVYRQYKEKANEVASGDPAIKQAAIRELANIMANGKKQLKELAAGMGQVDNHGEPTDERVKEAITQLVVALGKYTRGENPF